MADEVYQFRIDIEAGDSVSQVKRLERATERAARDVKSLGEKAGDADSALKGLAGAVGIVSPQMEVMLMRAGDALGGLEGLERGAGALGGQLSGPALLALGGFTAAVAAAGGALVLATVKARELLHDGFVPMYNEIENRDSFTEMDDAITVLQESFNELTVAIADEAAPDIAAALTTLARALNSLVQNVDKLMSAWDSLNSVLEMTPTGALISGAGELGARLFGLGEGAEDVAAEARQRRANRQAREAYEAGLDDGSVFVFGEDTQGVTSLADTFIGAPAGGAPAGGGGGRAAGRVSTAPQLTGLGGMQATRNEIAEAVYRDLYPTAPAPTALDLEAVMAAITPPSVLAALTGATPGTVQTSTVVPVEGVGFSGGAGGRAFDIEEQGQFAQFLSKVGVEDNFLALSTGEQLLSVLGGLEEGFQTFSSALLSGRFSGGFWADIFNAFLDLGAQGAAGVEETRIEINESLDAFFNDTLPGFIGETLTESILGFTERGGLLGRILEALPEIAAAFTQDLIPALVTNFIPALLEGLKNIFPGLTSAFGEGASAGDVVGGILDPAGLFRGLGQGSSQGFSISSEI